MFGYSRTAEMGLRPDTDELEALRQDLTSLMSLMLCLVGFVTTMFVPPDFSFPWGGRFLVFFSLLVEGLLALYLCRRWPLISRILLVLGPTSSFAGALITIDSSAVPFYAALIVVANLVISPAGGALAAILSGVTLFALSWADALLMPAMIFLVCTTALAWLSLRGFYTALAWSRNSQQHAAGLLAELRQHQGELNRTLTALTEATTRLQRVNRELLIARQQAEEARTLKEQFVANVSHELRTPLNLVVGFAEMMYLDPDGYEGVVWTPDLVSDVGELYRAAQHLQSLVSDILDLSRIDATRLPMFREMQPLHPIIAEAVETIAPLVRQRRLSCDLSIPEGLPPVFADRTRLRQVLLNLLNNAIRFTERGGIRVEAEKGDGAITVSIADTGVGIAEDQLGKLFDRFHQGEAGLRSAGGTGLGLALSRQFVELHGGKMWATSQVGRGSTFFFSIPLPGAIPFITPLRKTAGVSPRTRSQAPVIVVDPDPTIAEMLSRYLQDRSTLHAHNPGEAEVLIERERPLGIVVNQPPDRFAGDWIGPIGRLSEKHSVPVVRCSIPSPSWLTRSSGIDDCMSKPISRDSLARTALRDTKAQTILVVDDDRGFVSLIVRMLKSLAFEGAVVTAYTGKGALRLARQRKPDLVLLDLLLPDIDGFEVARALRADAALAGTRIVAVTATSYATEALRYHGGHFTLTRSGGLSTGILVELLNAVFATIQPDYATETST